MTIQIQSAKLFASRLVATRPFVVGILVTLISEAVLLFLVFPVSPDKQSLLKFDNTIGLALFTGVPLFLITIFQLHTASLVSRANFVREFATSIHTEKELSQSFYYLVYSYDNKTYDEFTKADKRRREELQGTREEGCRLFDPNEFQGTEEERRLDALLGFFDIIGYHHYRGVIHIRDVVGVLGLHLAALATRHAIVDYRKSIPEHWKKASFTRELKIETVAPFQYLSEMIVAFEKWNQRHVNHIADINRGRL